MAQKKTAISVDCRVEGLKEPPTINDLYSQRFTKVHVTKKSDKPLRKSLPVAPFSQDLDQTMQSDLVGVNTAAGTPSTQPPIEARLSLRKNTESETRKPRLYKPTAYRHSLKPISTTRTANEQRTSWVKTLKNGAEGPNPMSKLAIRDKALVKRARIYCQQQKTSETTKFDPIYGGRVFARTINRAEDTGVEFSAPPWQPGISVLPKNHANTFESLEAVRLSEMAPTDPTKTSSTLRPLHRDFPTHSSNKKYATNIFHVDKAIKTCA